MTLPSPHTLHFESSDKNQFILSENDRLAIYEYEKQRIQQESRKKLKRVLKAAGIGITVGAIGGATFGLGGAAALVAMAPVTASTIPAIGPTMIAGGSLIGSTFGGITKSVSEKNKIHMENEYMNYKYQLQMESNAHLEKMVSDLKETVSKLETKNKNNNAPTPATSSQTINSNQNNTPTNTAQNNTNSSSPQNKTA